MGFILTILYIEESEIITEKKNPSVKKVYRRIVTRTHPDKLEQLPNNSLKKGLIKKYKEAVNSYKDNDKSEQRNKSLIKNKSYNNTKSLRIEIPVIPYKN